MTLLTMTIMIYCICNDSTAKAMTNHSILYSVIPPLGFISTALEVAIDCVLDKVECS